MWNAPPKGEHVRIGSISSSTGEHGLAVARAPGELIDIRAAVAAAGADSPNAESLPTARNLKELILAGADEMLRLKALLAWVEERHERGTLPHGVVRLEAQTRFFPPISDPGKFLCVGKNYRAHLDELVRTELIKEIPDEPAGFIKLNEVINAHEAQVARPAGIEQFDYEPELAFVIGRDAHQVGREHAMDHVFGITLFNDLTAREIQRREVRVGTRFWTAKNMPGFGPIGPYVVTMDEVDDPHQLNISCYVNGELRSSFTTADMIHRIDRIIEHYSEYVPLHAGDLFATGSAAGVAAGQPNAAELFLKPGDVVEVVLPGVMTLRNHII
jgi:2-keto-4-pentenoate hydratase/2-oxohepta-3-ene-1,7-dioic acid hydratase in catechol pathway